MCLSIPSRINVQHTKIPGRPVITTVSKYDRSGRRIETTSSSFSSYDEKPNRRRRHRRRDSYESESYSSNPNKRSYPMVHHPNAGGVLPPSLPPPMYGTVGQPNRLLLEGPGTLPQPMGFNSGMGMRGSGMGGMNRPFDIVEASPVGSEFFPQPGPPPYNTHGGHAPPPPPIEDSPFLEPIGRQPRHNANMDEDFGGGGVRRRSSIPRNARMGGGLPSGVRYGHGNIMDDNRYDMSAGGGYPGSGRYRN